MEQREAAETMTLASLRRCANALECDLVYFLMPRQSLNKAVEQRAYAHARAVMATVAHSMSLEAQGVSADEVEAQIRDLAEKLIRDTDSCIWNKP